MDEVTAYIEPAAGSVSGWNTVPFTAADFNSMVNGGFALSTAAIVNDGTATNLAIQFAVEVVTGGTTASTSFMSVWMMEDGPGGTYGDGTQSGTAAPSAQYWTDNVGIAQALTSGATAYGVSHWNDLGFGAPKIGIGNSLGVALGPTASATISYRVMKLQGDASS